MALAFEWDREKAAANLKKHGISFETATAVFLDARRLEDRDELLEYGEVRLNTIGLVAGFELLVTFTMRGENYRIISARKATRNERRNYWDR